MSARGKRPSNRLVRRGIREIIEPKLAEMGFACKYPEFRRRTAREHHFIMFQTARYGGSFAILGGWMPRSRVNGGAIDHYGTLVPEDAITIAHVGFDRVAHIERIVDLCSVMDREAVRQSAGDFEYAHIVEDEILCRTLVEEAGAALPQLDHWLHTREAGEAISCKGHRPVQGVSKQLLWHMACAMTGNFDLSNKRPDTSAAIA